MKTSIFLAASALVLALPTKRSGSGYVHVPLQRKEGRAPLTINGTAIRPVKRSVDDEDVQFTGIRYFANYSIGTPPQPQSAILDTGSTDVWTFGSAAWSSGFNGAKSSTYQWENNDFTDSYGDGSNTVAGSWAEDIVTLGDASVSNFPFAYLNQTDPDFPDNRGIFGIGRRATESANPEYPPFIERLKDAGTTEANAFSLYMTNSDATEASLLIGGVDSAKYSGDLYTIPFDSGLIHSGYYSIQFELSGQTFTSIVDSGTPEVLVNQNLADELAAQYGAVYSDDVGGYIRTSPPADNLPDLPYSIGGIELSIPGSEMFVEYEGLWLFAISRSIVEDGFFELNIIGDPIMRQLYLVYDLDNNELGFAPVKITDDSNIVAISSTIPGGTPAPSPGQTSQLL